jgi:hypothetical protein
VLQRLCALVLALAPTAKQSCVCMPFKPSKPVTYPVLQGGNPLELVPALERKITEFNEEAGFCQPGGNATGCIVPDAVSHSHRHRYLVDLWRAVSASGHRGLFCTPGLAVATNASCWTACCRVHSSYDLVTLVGSGPA